MTYSNEGNRRWEIKKKRFEGMVMFFFIYHYPVPGSLFLIPSFEARERKGGRESLGMRLFVNLNDLFVNSRTG